MSKRPPGDRGYLLVSAILAVFLLMIFLPVLLRLVREEVRTSVRRVHMDEMISTGEAGLDRGAYKLGESDLVWTQVQQGIPVPEYNGDRVWQDLNPDYEYKIILSSGPKAEQATVQCKVRSLKQPAFVRVLEGIYSRNLLDALVMQKDFTAGTLSTPQVHWAPLKSYESLNVTVTNPLPFFPRKYALLGIGNRDTVRNTVNSDQTEYWAFDKNIGAPPVLDMEYYRPRARASAVPLDTPLNGRLRMRDGGTNPVAAPAGSAYFSCGDNFDGTNQGILFTALAGGNYRFANSTTVVMLENLGGAACRAELGDRVFLDLEALVVVGAGADLRLGARNFNNFQATVPVNADLEYADPNAVSAWTGGTPSMQTVWGTPTRCCYPVNNVGFHGLLHVRDGVLEVTNDQNTSVVGMVYAREILHGINTNRLRVYYDDAVGDRVKVIYTPLRRRLYREVRGLTW